MKTPLDWTVPDCYEVAPDVFRIPLSLPNDGLKAVNVYALTGEAGPILIDSGWAIDIARGQLESALRVLGYELPDIQRFLVTHVHRDHYAQAVALRREFGTRVSLGVGEREGLTRTLDEPGPPLRWTINKLRPLGATALAEEMGARLGLTNDAADAYDLPDDWLSAGPIGRIAGRDLEVVPTPGHTVGHVVFHDTAGSLLFAGDHVLPTITPSIGFEAVTPANPLGNFLASLALVRSRPDALLLPAHGEVAASVHARVDELIDHHGKRLEDTELAVRRGADTGLAAAGHLLWTRREKRLADLDPFNQMLAIVETGAHLALLVAQGRLAMTDTEECVRFRAL